MQTDPFSEIEARIDAKYAELKSALRLLREQVVQFSGTQTQTAPKSPETSNPIPAAGGIAPRIRAAVASMPGEFGVSHLSPMMPDLTKVQISNAMTMLRKNGEIVVVTEGRGAAQTIYRKAEAPSGASTPNGALGT